MSCMFKTALLPLGLATVLAAQVALADTQAAGAGKWDGFPYGACADPSSVRYDGVARTSRYVTMPDGVKIAVDLYLPTGLERNAKIPTVMQYTRYWRATEGQEATSLQSYFVSRGYAFAVFDERGTGASFGVWPHPWSRKGVQDVRGVVEWLVAQPWSNGKVGTVGSSYEGATAALAAAAGHPAVRAVVPRFHDFDIYGFIYPGGVYLDGLIRFWSDAIQSMDRNTGQPIRFPTENRRVRRVDEDTDGAMLAAAVREHAANPNFYEAMKATPFRDARSALNGASMDDWSLHSFRPEIEHSGAAIYTWASWLDDGTAHGAIRQYLTFSNPQRVIIGPWGHGAFDLADPYATPGTAVAPQEVQQAEILCYFDHHLKGKANGIGDNLFIYYTYGEGKWKRTRQFPPSRTQSQRWYLDAGNALSKDAPRTAAGADKYTVDFSDSSGKSNRWQTQAGGGAVLYDDPSKANARRLVYTSAPFDSDVEITGYPVVSFDLASTATDGVVYVYLQDVSPTGKVVTVSDGLLRLIHRKVSTDAAPFTLLVPYQTFKQADAEPLTPGRITTVNFGLYPTSVLVRQGHRLRIAISGADKDTFPRIPADGPAPQLTLQRNLEHASFIELPIITASNPVLP